MAAQIKSELKIDVEMIHGKYGEFKVLVDGTTIIDGGAKVIVGIMPSADSVVEAVRRAIDAGKTPSTNI